jgi:hypothetical protein
VVDELVVLLRRPEAPPQLLLGAARPPRHAARPIEVASKLPLRQLLAAFRNEALAGPGKEDDSEERERGWDRRKWGIKERARAGGRAGGRSQVGTCSTAYCSECDQCTLARTIHPLSVFVPPHDPVHFSARLISFNFSLVDPFCTFSTREKGCRDS